MLALESIENLMPQHNHRRDALQRCLRVSLQSAYSRHVFVPEEERCRNVGGFPVQNVKSHVQISSARGSPKAIGDGKMIRVTTPIVWLDVGFDEVLSTASESLPLPISVKSLADHASAKVMHLVKLEGQRFHDDSRPKSRPYRRACGGR